MRSASVHCFVIGGLLWLLAGATSASDDASAERQRIAREREVIENQYRAEQAECARRFTVNACTEEAKQRRREALQPLRQQELLLSDRERKQRAAERAKVIERNRVEADTRALAPAPIASSVRGRPGLAAASAPARERPASAPRGVSEKAAERASESARRRQDVQADKQRIRSRLEKRAAEGKKVAPLPAPDARP